MRPLVRGCSARSARKPLTAWVKSPMFTHRQYDAADASEAPIIAAMVTISITPTAFEAIAATLSTGYTAEGRPDGKGGYLVTLDRHVIERLAAMRRPRESYSDVMLRLVETTAFDDERVV
jgi:hypothetical protein